MLELLLGLGIGAVAFTEKGRELGNKAASVAVQMAKKAVEDVKNKSAERPAGTAGNDSSDC